MQALRTLFAHYEAYHATSRPIIKYMGMVGAVTFPLFFLLTLGRPESRQYDNPAMRVAAALLCVGLALKEYWPQRMRPYYVAYSYGVFTYCLAFFASFTALKNGADGISLMNSLMAVFFLVLLSDWRNTVAMLFVGGGVGVFAYMLTTPEPTALAAFVTRLPTFAVVVLGGSLFKFSEKQTEAEKIRQTYRALAGSIAHEMRSPLGQVQHALEGIGSALPAEPQDHSVCRHVAQGQDAVKRGLQVIDMILDEVGAKPPDSTRWRYLSAAQLVQKAIDEYGYETESERAKVSVSVIDDFTLRADETACLFVLFNLIKNALYYLKLDDGATITLTVSRPNISVLDTGPGIPAHRLPSLFESFQTAGKSGGTGLGLPYCKRTMQAFGGDIFCESALGQYTEFVLRFPEVAAQDIEASWHAQLKRVRPVLAGARILLVDDDPLPRRLAAAWLMAGGAVTQEAPDGAVALTMLASGTWDLVLTDLDMPVMDGYTLARRIRNGAVPHLTHVPMIAHSSEKRYLASVKTQKAGMDAFVGKPCHRMEMLELVSSLLEKKHAALPAIPPGTRVLVADDSAVNRSIVAAKLSQRGFVVVEAAHGQAALALLEGDATFDAILMDVQMPGLDGTQTTRAIRARAWTYSQIPVIALSGSSDQGSVQEALAAGMDDTLSKPLDIDAFCAKLGPLLARRGAAVGDVLIGAVTHVAVPTAEGDVQSGESRQTDLVSVLPMALREMQQRLNDIERGFAARDITSISKALHRLKGTAAEVGALVLHAHVLDLHLQPRGELTR